MLYIIGFLLVIGILVTIHEWGHFIVARLCGVGVERFSVGFGKVLYKRTDKHGTEWALSLIPLGGYVKMIDERVAEVPPEKQHLSFIRKKVWQRAAIVSAGPVANFVLAFLLFMGLYIVGIKDIRPVIGAPLANTPAAKAGLVGGETIVDINNRPIHGWHDIKQEMIDAVFLKGEPLILSYRLPDSDPREPQSIRTVSLSPLALSTNDNKNAVHAMDNLGLSPPFPRPLSFIGVVEPNTPAHKAGLLKGDRIVSIDGLPITYWEEVATLIQAKPAKRINVQVERADTINASLSTPAPATLITLSILTETIDFQGKTLGRIGIRPNEDAFKLDPRWIFRHALPVDEAIVMAGQKVVESSVTMLNFLKGMLRGEVSWRFLNGPVAIADVAGKSLADGLNSFVQLISMISISLGVMNLLPLPVLDGGHLVFLAYEAITKKRPSELFLDWAHRLGVGALFLLMSVAIFNDIQLFI